jgi:hypothetical protein
MEILGKCTNMSLYPNNPPVLIPSFVCHVDILGYAQLCQKAIQSNTSDALLNKVRDALNSAYDRVRKSAQSWDGNNRFEIKIFTDNIIVGYPLTPSNDSFGEAELGRIFNVFSEFQVALAMEGFLVRGGIAYGKHYMDEDIVFGDALIEAVKQDTSGGAPKVSLAPSAIKALQHHLSYYSNIDSSPQSYDLLQDADESVFINYLQKAFIGFPDGGVFFDVFVKHKQTLVKGLTENKGIPSVKAKYEWAARYHNSVIDTFLQNNPIPTRLNVDEVYTLAITDAQDLIEHKIDIESFAEAPGKLRLEPKASGT